MSPPPASFTGMNFLMGPLGGPVLGRARRQPITQTWMLIALLCAALVVPLTIMLLMRAREVGDQLTFLEDLPTLTVRGGVADLAGPLPLTYVDQAVLLQFDTRARARFPQGYQQFESVFFIGSDAILLRFAGREREILWAEVNDRVGPIRADGVQIVSWFRQQGQRWAIIAGVGTWVLLVGVVFPGLALVGSLALRFTIPAGGPKVGFRDRFAVALAGLGPLLVLAPYLIRALWTVGLAVLLYLIWVVLGTRPVDLWARAPLDEPT